MKRRRKSGRKMIFIRFGIVVYIALSMFGVIWTRASVIGLEYEIGKLDRQRADLVKERRLARATKANYYSSSRIEKAALKRLGMKMPERTDVFIVTKLNPAGLYKASGR